MQVIEVIGLAGAGKSTFTRAFKRHEPMIDRRVQIARPHLGWEFTRHTFRFLPSYLQQLPSTRWFTREEMRAMIYLTAWPYAIRQQALSRSPRQRHLQLLDLGPIYRLTYLREFGSPLTQQPSFRHWCGRVGEQWRTFLDMVIWLDAPDAVLHKRINARTKTHVVKGHSLAECEAFFRRYREGYGKTVATMITNGGPTLLRLDTSQYQVDELVKIVTQNIRWRTPA